MSGKKRRSKTKDSYTRHLEGFIARYVEATGDRAWTNTKVAAWAIDNDLWEQRKPNAVRELARHLSRVARQVTITDEKDRQVRKYHAFRLGQDQPMLWADIEFITPEQMNESKTMRRNTLAAGCIPHVPHPKTLRYFEVFRGLATNDICMSRLTSLCHSCPYCQKALVWASWAKFNLVFGVRNGRYSAID